MLYAPPPYVRHYYYYWFWGRAGPGGFVCLEEHRPGLGRDDGDEAQYEVHFRTNFGNI